MPGLSDPKDSMLSIYHHHHPTALKAGSHEICPQPTPGLWFRDGNIVLQVGHKLFKLHAGFLEECSSVLYHLISDPNAPSGHFFGGSNSEDFDPINLGCPLIKLIDSADDGEHFFKSLYDPGYFEPPPSKTTTEITLGILRMSKKYDVPSLCRRALSHLILSFPLTLYHWDDRSSRSTFSIRGEMSTSTTFSNTLDRTLTIIETATYAGMEFILPSCLYDACQYEIDVLLHHPRWTQGSLDEEMKNRLIIAGKQLADATTTDILKFLLIPPPSDCISPQSCSDIRRDCMFTHALLFPKQNPLEIWDDNDWDTYLDGMCDECMRICSDVHQQAREKLWSELPELFGLEPWSTLKSAHDTVTKSSSQWAV